MEFLLQSNTTPEFKRLAADLILTFAGEIPAEHDLSKLINQPAPLSSQRRGAGGEVQSPTSITLPP